MSGQKRGDAKPDAALDVMRADEEHERRADHNQPDRNEGLDRHRHERPGDRDGQDDTRIGVSLRYRQVSEIRWVGV